MTLGIVFEVYTEGGGGGVVEDRIHLQLEQVCGVQESRLFNFGCVLIEKIHGLVPEKGFDLPSATGFHRSG